MEGNFNGQQVTIPDAFGHHEFTPEEAEALFAGKTIAFNAHSDRTGNDYRAVGYIGDYNGHLGFVLDLNAKADLDNADDFMPKTFGGVELTSEQREKLMAGERVHLTGCVSARTGNTYDCDVVWADDDQRPGHKRLVPDFNR